VIVRRLIAIFLGLLLAVQVSRNAAVSALADRHPATAAKVWAAHPSVQIPLALSQIGTAARERRSIGQDTFAMIDEAAEKAPLSPEPFLVRGVQAQMEGEGHAAKEAFLAAQRRDPRSLAAAYFLADYYFRAGDPLTGLKQAALLAKLSPNGTSAVAPFVAAYAQNRSNWPQIRALFRSDKGLEDDVLAALALDAGNSGAILALADADHRKPDSPWLRVLLQKLVAERDYRKARTIWTSIAGGSARDEQIYDGGFATPRAPPPFNWDLTSSTVGLAERQAGKGLHVIFYGNQDGVLATELMLLPPGAYRLQMQLLGAPLHPELLTWSIRCDKSEQPIASADISRAAVGGLVFQVPEACAAQWLELTGRSEDISQQSEVTIAGLRLTTPEHDA
jgi:hypothetical protein